MRVLRDWYLTSERLAVHLPSGTAVVADLHLGYGAARRRGGEAVPMRTLDEELAPLRRCLERLDLRRLVIAGDLLEDRRQTEHAEALLPWLDRAGVELAGFVAGNHDGAGRKKVQTMPPFDRAVACVQLGRWQVVHGDAALPQGAVVQGHEHPCVRWSSHLAAPCFLVGKGYLVLPAYSPDAAGVNVLGSARWGAYRCCAIAGDKVLDFGPVAGLSGIPTRARRSGQGIRSRGTR